MHQLKFVVMSGMCSCSGSLSTTLAFSASASCCGASSSRKLSVVGAAAGTGGASGTATTTGSTTVVLRFLVTEQPKYTVLSVGVRSLGTGRSVGGDSGAKLVGTCSSIGSTVVRVSTSAMLAVEA